MVLDMTKGSPIGKIMRFFVPVMLGNLLQQFYSLADSFIVSRFLGVEAFAGVSATGSLHFLIIGFTWGVCSGFAIPISQEFGAGNQRGLRRCFANSLYLSAIIAFSMAILTAILTPQILNLIGTPADIFDYSCTYIRILFIGLPATVMYNLMAGVMRAVGDGRTPLIMLLFSTVLNIILDLLMVVAFKMGIAGAAIATVVSQLVSGILCVIVIFRKFDVLKIKKDEWGNQSLHHGPPHGHRPSHGPSVLHHRRWLHHPPGRGQLPWLFRRGLHRRRRKGSVHLHGPS